jgi:hypothetical protein
MMKAVTIAVAGTGGQREYKDVSLMPGTTPRDVMSTLKLTGFQLSRPEGGMFAHGDDLYASVADGQKIYAVKSDVEAGTWRASGKSHGVLSLATT